VHAGETNGPSGSIYLNFANGQVTQVTGISYAIFSDGNYIKL